MWPKLVFIFSEKGLERLRIFGKTPEEKKRGEDLISRLEIGLVLIDYELRGELDKLREILGSTELADGGRQRH